MFLDVDVEGLGIISGLIYILWSIFLWGFVFKVSEALSACPFVR